MKKTYLIVADDFTGSNDTGVQLAKSGIDTRVVLFPEEGAVEGSVVLDTESRTIAAADARAKVRDLAERVLAGNDFALVYKKLDSTLRGNVGEEIAALAEVYRPDRIVVAPAFPSIGRTTLHGIHYLNGVRLMETELANDPLNPVWTDDVLELVARDLSQDVHLHPAVDAGSDLDLSGSYVHVFDAVEDAQLDALASSALAAAEETGERVLYVGCAGFAGALFRALANGVDEDGNDATGPVEAQTESIAPGAPTLSIVGSVSSVSFQQMAYAESQGIDVVSITADELLGGDVEGPYTSRVSTLLDEGRDVVLTTTRSREEYDACVRSFAEAGYENEQRATLVKETLARIALAAMRGRTISGMFLTGGDTAIEIIRRTDAAGCRICREVDTGVVLSTVVGGSLAGMPVVTKAGAFGTESSLYQSICEMKGQDFHE